MLPPLHPVQQPLNPAAPHRNNAAAAASSSSSMLPPHPPVKSTLHVWPIQQKLIPASPLMHWSDEELLQFSDGLRLHANERNNLDKYLRVAAWLPNKTVRDVVLMCQYQMALAGNSQRHKPEDSLAVKRIKDKNKRKTADSSLMPGMHSVQVLQYNNTGYAPTTTTTTHPVHHDAHPPHEASAIDSRIWSLLSENDKLLGLIASNIEMSKGAEHNVDMFFRARENINTISNSLSDMPLLMKLRPLNVRIDERLFWSIFCSHFS